MKKKILVSSLAFAGVATMLALIAIVKPDISPSDMDATVNSIAATTKLYASAGVFGLLSISSFFVGLAFPKEN